MSPKTSPKGEFEGLEAASTKCEWLGVRITVRIWSFGVSRVIMLFFLYFAQKLIRVGPLASLALGLVVLSDYLRKIAFFSDSSIFFPFFEYFSVFWSFGAFFHGQAAFYYEKRPVLAILSAFGIFRCWRHRKT